MSRSLTVSKRRCDRGLICATPQAVTATCTRSSCVNPTLLTLATQRGNIDCGGLRYLIVGYGHFHQLVVPSPAGHVSIAFELGANPADCLQAILGVMADHGQPQSDAPARFACGGHWRRCAVGALYCGACGMPQPHLRHASGWRA
jgi:hypothetical protein